jgi:hypothetical protein
VFGKETVALNSTYLFERLVNHVRVEEMIVREEVELIQEISDINAAERIHLRERQNTWESGYR